MLTVGDIREYIESIAPFGCAESWDNCGILIGSARDSVSAVMPVLDVTRPVAEEALQKRVDLILSHHPIIFEGLTAIESDSVVYRLVQSGVAVLSAHTNLDVAAQGVSQMLSDALGLRDARILQPLGVQSGEPYGVGRIGRLAERLQPEQLAARVRDTLGCAAVRLVSGGAPIQTVAVANGAEGGLLSVARAQGADALVAGEVKHNVMVDALNAGITLIEAGHFETENGIVPILESGLQTRFPDLRVVHSAQNLPPYRVIGQKGQDGQNGI